MDEFDLEDYKAASHSTARTPVRRARRQAHPFLRGPVPIWWLARAARLPGKALAVGIALWFRKGIVGRDTVKPSWALWRRLGIGRHAAYRDLRNLEASGLVTVKRRVGKNPIVKITTEPQKDWLEEGRYVSSDEEE